MRALLTSALLISLWPVPVGVKGQETDSLQRTREILVSFNKKRHAVKEKYGVRRERYREIRSEPAVKQDVRDFSGSYEVPGLGYFLNIRVSRDGTVEADGYEPAGANAQQRRRFTLKGARLSGALLTAVKGYEGGSAEKFEGLFINRTEFDSPTAGGVSTFGLGVVGQRMEAGGVTLDKLFYQKKQ